MSSGQGWAECSIYREVLAKVLFHFLSPHPQKAFSALCHSTHLYGRRLVLEWADSEVTLQALRRKTAEHFHGKSGAPRGPPCRPVRAPPPALHVCPPPSPPLLHAGRLSCVDSISDLHAFPASSPVRSLGGLAGNQGEEGSRVRVLISLPPFLPSCHQPADTATRTATAPVQRPSTQRCLEVPVASPGGRLP